MSQELIPLDPDSPTGIMGVDKAHLPAVYEQAVAYARQCQNIDEAKEWATNADALAAYAKMKGQKELEHVGKSLRQQWTRRYGELARLVDHRGGDHKSQKSKEKNQKSHSDTFDLATKVTPRFKNKAANFAAAPKGEFDKAVKAGASDNKLAKMGKKSRAKKKLDVRNPRSPEYKAANALLVTLRAARDDTRKIRLTVAIDGLSAGEKKQVATLASQIVDWLLALRKKL